MHIERFVCNQFQENCYVVSDETGECVIIDCGALHPAERSAIIGHIRQGGLVPRHLLCTHGHLDHVFGNRAMWEAFGLAPELHPADAGLLSAVRAQALALAGMDYAEEQPEPAYSLVDGATVAFGNHALKVMHTPGHSPGSVVLYCEGESLAFSGDTLFRMGIGRTDFEGGDPEAIIASLRGMTERLPGDTTVLPGHGPATTIGEERALNPYIH